MQINYGIKTGFNDAFIISTEKREEILGNCKSEDERQRTAALIRPILRGRDIKRYGYELAGYYLIATFPSMHYDIEDYPAVKDYLLSFGIERLEQTGKRYIIDGQQIMSRKKTNNKWFETQDSISYVDDFNKPKIVWKRIGSLLRFSYDEGGALGLDSTCFATGEHIPYLCCLLNSKMGNYMLKDSPKTGTGDLLISVQAVEPIRVAYDKNVEDQLEPLLHQIVNQYNIAVEDEINRIIFSLYNLSPEEITYVSEVVSQFR